MMKDEHPSQEDVERFSDETAYCPFCGAEIWDDASTCVSCGELLSSGTSSKDPTATEVSRKMVVLITIIIIIAFLSSMWAIL